MSRASDLYRANRVHYLLEFAMDEDDGWTDTTSCSLNYDEEYSQSSRGFSVPNFNVTTWNPDLPVGLHYISLVPLSLTPDSGNKQKNNTGKIRTSKVHRKQRLKDFQSGKTNCRNILDERRLRSACNENDLITDALILSHTIWLFNTLNPLPDGKTLDWSKLKGVAVVELLDGGADASCEDDKKRTPLHFAASQGHVNIVKALLDKGADPNKKDFIGNTPLHLAACTCQVPVVTLLLKAGTDVKSMDLYGRSPLALAKSRLKFLAEEKAISSDKIKNEVIEISDMMKTYLSLSGCHDDAGQLEELCSKLKISSTREEVDLVNTMLSDFASLTIQKKGT